MDAPTLFAIAGGLVALAAFAGWRGARPPDFRKGPRLVPWRAIMVFTATAAIIVLVQAERLAGWAPGGR
jgi:hypothetical protein